MRESVFLSFVILILLASLSVHAEFQAGIAFRNVTPDPLLPISGGVGPSEPAETKKGELTVRALVLKDADTTVAIVSTDFLGFPAVLGDRVRAMVKDIPPENILIGATHAHSAPDCYGFADEKGNCGADLNYLDRVCKETAGTIQDALGQIQPISVKIATGEAKGKIAYNYYAEQLYDPRCNVLQCLRADGTPIATLVNYAIHPEVLGPDRKILSPDLVGPLYDRIAEKGGGVGIFMNSAQGGMVTADCRGANRQDVQTWEECVRIGNLLADESIRIVADAPVQKEPDLFCAATRIAFPIDSPMMRAIVQNSPLGYKLGPDATVSTQVNVVNLGNAQMLTIPGEALPNIGYYLKRKMHGEINFLLGLTNDAFGYMLTKVDFDSFKRYEYISRTSLGEMTGEIFIEKALAFVDSCPVPKGLDR
ncbi:MAG TPA: hypothetical protein PLG59_03085 [bacterium]|nr:hypothetical protein [bacterium]